MIAKNSSMAAAVVALALLAGPVWPQSDDTANEGEAPAEDSTENTEEAQEEEKAPMPELTGTASGTADGIPFSAPVDCSGFTTADMVRVQSDPGAASGEDLTGDGFFLDTMASRGRGSIDLNLSVNNTSYNFSGRLAQVSENTLSYAVTLKSSNGPDISITLKVACPA